MPKVFVVNKGCHNHQDAERFGELQYLSEGAMNRYATSNMHRLFLPQLLESAPEDYILPTGLTVMNIIACGIFAKLHGRLNLLIYKASRKGEEGRYVERVIMLDIGEEEL